MALSLTQDQYEALVGMARTGATTEVASRALDALLSEVDLANEVTRYLLLVRWQEIGQVIPANIRFPESWPPEFQLRIETIGTPISREVVVASVASRAKRPYNILVTEDSAGIVGWATLDQYFGE